MLPNLVFERQIRSLKSGMQELRVLQAEIEQAGVEIRQAAQEPPSGGEALKAATQRLIACAKKTLELEAKYKRDLDALSRLEQGLVAQVIGLHSQLTQTRHQAVRQGFGSTAVFDYRTAPDDHASHRADPFH
jgi:hypothetical protein